MTKKPRPPDPIRETIEETFRVVGVDPRTRKGKCAVGKMIITVVHLAVDLAVKDSDSNGHGKSNQ